MHPTLATDHRTALTPKHAFFRHKFALLSVVFFSGLINLLMLTGALYMLNIYDRVVPSGSKPTLIALSVIAATAFICSALLDLVRHRILANIAQAVARELTPEHTLPHDTGARIDTLGALIASPLPLGLIDLVWAPIYFVALALLHPALCLLAVGGAALSLGAAALGASWGRSHHQAAQDARTQADRTLSAAQQAELPRGVPAHRSLTARWHRERAEHQHHERNHGLITALTHHSARGFRHIVQSGAIGLGAWLAVDGHISAGAIFAGSLLLGRALAPIDTLSAQWGNAISLRKLLRDWPQPAPRTPWRNIPHPTRALTLQDVTQIYPAQTSPALRRVSFQTPPGHVVGICGPCGSGKTTLARLIAGVTTPTSGSIRIGLTPTANLHASHTTAIGYVSARAPVVTGSWAEAIYGAAPHEATIDELSAATGLDTLIARDPTGIDGVLPQTLSLGQKRRVALARALVCDPYLLVIDSLSPGLTQLNLAPILRARKAAGAITVIIDDAQSNLTLCDEVLTLYDGVLTAHHSPSEQCA